MPWSRQNKSRAVAKMWQCLAIVFQARKGGDALASLRWTHFAAEYAELLKAGTPLPDEVVVVCDNCVGPSRFPAPVSV